MALPRVARLSTVRETPDRRARTLNRYGYLSRWHPVYLAGQMDAVAIEGRCSSYFSHSQNSSPLEFRRKNSEEKLLHAQYPRPRLSQRQFCGGT
jgi:hypothetical protein